jgi:hypothetical protein
MRLNRLLHWLYHGDRRYRDLHDTPAEYSTFTNYFILIVYLDQDKPLRALAAQLANQQWEIENRPAPHSGQERDRVMVS